MVYSRSKITFDENDEKITIYYVQIIILVELII